MGFWGTFVVHRDPRPLAEVFPELATLAAAGRDTDPTAAGWSVTRTFDADGELPEDFVTRLRDTTQAPAMTARVLDSSAAYVCAAGIDTPPWQVWLHLEGALGYLLDPPAPFDDAGNYLGPDWVDPQYEAACAALRQRLRAEAPGGAEGAAAAVAWARDAGLSPSGAEEVGSVVEGRGPFAEDLFLDLLERLGVIERKAG